MSEERRGKYLGFVAHEIKNPLSTALWSVDLLKRMDGPERSGPRGEKVIDASLRALRRMRRLVDDYFTLERLEGGAFELHRVPLELGALATDVLAQLQEKDGIAAARLYSEVPAGLAFVGDRDLLLRGLRGMIELLLRPAAEARIGLYAARIGRELQLIVRAEGLPRPLRPLPPEERDGADPAGATFGFVLCEAVVRAHGGSLEEREDGLHLKLPAPQLAALS